MQKTILLIVGLVIVVFGAIFALNMDDDDVPAPEKHSNILTPILEVVSASIYRAEEGRLTELTDGAKLNTPVTLLAAAGAKAIIHMPDGSQARLDSDTELTLSEAIYDEDTEDSSVKISLNSGRVWSKVVDLVSPESSWEVETSNIVATVRGTAFGVSVDDGITELIGSENAVAVLPIDPDTRERATTTPTILTEESHILVTDELAKVAIEKSEVLVVEKIAFEVRRQQWVIENESADETVNEEIEKFEQEGVDIRERGKRLFEDSKTRIEAEREVERKEELSKKIEDEIAPDSEEISDISDDTDIRLIDSVEIERKIEYTVKDSDAERAIIVVPIEDDVKRDVVVEVATPISIEIKPATVDKVLSEGDTIQFSATLTYSDGSTRDVTNEAEWNVIDGIGTIEKGAFTAQLQVRIRELGSGKGNIFVAWFDPGTGLPYIAQTNKFEVRAKIIELKPVG